MATMLYETLEVSKEATIDEIRKAYKKKALQTHPDRLPQGSTPDDKKNSEEQFRLVNNAYEILIDPHKRKTYDKYGVFPPPEPQQAPSRPNHDRQRNHTRPFNDPFMSRGFAFTDPFALFDEIFGEDFPEWRHRHSRFHGPSPFMSMDPFFSPFANPFGRSPVGIGGLLARMEQEIFGMSMSHPLFPSHPFPAIESPLRNRRDGLFRQESYTTQMINGVTQSVHKRIDFDGNEHVTRTYPDGREIHTVNGVEQPVHGYLSDTKDTGNGSRRFLSGRRNERLSTSGHFPQGALQPQPVPISRSSYANPPPPSYGTRAYNTSYPISRGRDNGTRSERRMSSNGYDVDPDGDSRMYDIDNHYNGRRGWWASR